MEQASAYLVHTSLLNCTFWGGGGGQECTALLMEIKVKKNYILSKRHKKTARKELTGKHLYKSYRPRIIYMGLNRNYC